MRSNITQKFQQNKKRQFDVSLAAWKISEGISEYLEWPYKFYSDENYIFIIAEEGSGKEPVDKEKVPVQFAEMFFNAQYLKKYLKIERKLNLFETNFTLTLYSYYGDNQEDELQGRLNLTSMMVNL